MKIEPHIPEWITIETNGTKFEVFTSLHGGELTVRTSEATLMLVSVQPTLDGIIIKLAKRQT